MPRASNGTYTAPTNSWNTAVTNSVIDPADWNEQLADYITWFGTNSLDRTGQGAMQATLDMGTHAISGATNIGMAGTLGTITNLTISGTIATVTNLTMSGTLGTPTSLTMAGPITGITSIGMSNTLSMAATGIFQEKVNALTLANGANTDITLTSGTYFRIAGPTGAFSTTGFTGGIDGRVINIFNPIAQNWTITNDATSTAANRILTCTGADVVTTGVAFASFIYSSDDSRWILAGCNT